MSTIEELKVKARAALDTGNDNDFMAVVAEINKVKADIAKALALAAQVEATELAGVREALGLDIFKLVKDLKLDKRIADVKAYGFTYKINRVDKSVTPEVKIIQTTANLITPEVKTARKSGMPGSKRGSLQEDFEKLKSQYAVATGIDIDAEYAAALVKDATVTNQGFSYNVKNKVRKWGLAQGLLAPVK